MGLISNKVSVNHFGQIESLWLQESASGNIYKKISFKALQKKCANTYSPRPQCGAGYKYWNLFIHVIIFLFFNISIVLKIVVYVG